MPSWIVLAGGVAGLVLALAMVVAVRLRRLWPVYSLLSVAGLGGVPVLPISPGYAFSLLMAPRALGRLRGAGVRHVVVPFALLFLASAVSVRWSPDKVSAVSVLVGIVSVFLASVVACALLAQGVDPLRSALRAAAPVIAVQALTTWLFLLSPAAESAYLHSRWAGLFIGRQAELIYTTMPNNVLSAEKAGGLLFVNGNQASMMLGTIGMLYVAYAIRARSGRSALVGLVAFAGAVGTYSKTGIVLCLALPAVMFVVASYASRKRTATTVILGTIVLPIGALAAIFAVRSLDRLTERIEVSADARSVLWSAAASLFREHPWRGLGFGGWQVHWAQIAPREGMSPTLPPHNFLIYAWSQSGVVAAVLVAALLLTMGFRLFRRIVVADDYRNACSSAFELGALLWIVVHGMFDNTNFYGTAHTVPFFAVLVASSTRAVLGRPARTRRPSAVGARVRSAA